MPRSNNESFSPEQTEAFREMLVGMRREITQGIQARISQKREDLGPKEIGDQFDSASEGREQELGYLMNTRDRQKVLRIEEALRRLDDGEYGICEECEEPIGVKRLHAMPFTKLCVRCQEQEEAAEQMARERELEEDERQYFELAENELGEEEEIEE